MYNKNSPKKIFFLGLDKHFFSFFLNLVCIFYNKMTLFTLDKLKKTKKTDFMQQNMATDALKIIEVPPELRGLSDEEIIRNSEEIPKKFEGRRKNGAARPSKRERLAQKEEKAKRETEQIVAEIFGKSPVQSSIPQSASATFPAVTPLNELPSEKRKMLESAFTPSSKGYSVVKAEEKSEHVAPRSMISEMPKPASGRVLKASFGAKNGTAPKAVIVSAADLAKQKAEARAKKIQEFFRSKHPEATTMPDGAPIKRPRGRPRKNPL